MNKNRTSIATIFIAAFLILLLSVFGAKPAQMAQAAGPTSTSTAIPGLVRYLRG